MRASGQWWSRREVADASGLVEPDLPGLPGPRAQSLVGVLHPRLGRCQRKTLLNGELGLRQPCEITKGERLAIVGAAISQHAWPAGLQIADDRDLLRNSDNDIRAFTIAQNAWRRRSALRNSACSVSSATQVLPSR
jgi:hypothetical protein